MKRRRLAFWVGVRAGLESGLLSHPPPMDFCFPRYRCIGGAATWELILLGGGGGKCVDSSGVGRTNFKGGRTAGGDSSVVGGVSRSTLLPKNLFIIGNYAVPLRPGLWRRGMREIDALIIFSHNLNVHPNVGRIAPVRLFFPSCRYSLRQLCEILIKSALPQRAKSTIGVWNGSTEQLLLLRCGGLRELSLKPE